VPPDSLAVFKGPISEEREGREEGEGRGESGGREGDMRYREGFGPQILAWRPLC